MMFKMSLDEASTLELPYITNIRCKLTMSCVFNAEEVRCTKKYLNEIF